MTSNAEFLAGLADFIGVDASGILTAVNQPPAGDSSARLTTTAFISALVGGDQAATSSLAASGYQKLPSGLIVQWGYGSTSGTASPNLVVTLPTAWASGAFFAGGFGNGWGATCEFVSGTTTSLSLCYRLSGTPANGEPVFWFAIGK